MYEIRDVVNSNTNSYFFPLLDIGSTSKKIRQKSLKRLEDDLFEPKSVVAEFLVTYYRFQEGET